MPPRTTPTARDVLTPDALAMLQTIHTAGSFAAAARQLSLVPSALTYRVRQIEDALDVLLYDRSSRQARLTEAGAELLREETLSSTLEALNAGQADLALGVAVADSVQRGKGLTVGLLAGQDVFTVSSMQAKLDAQLRGMGGGFVPECMARGFIETGRLVVKKTELPLRLARVSYAWRGTPARGQGRALQWWLKQLDSPATRSALLEQHRGV